ncbi:hypothetical protein E4K10_26700 [Streptomyces sp. T1317-0309]|nr:hypothetical protein E4K10_26700 [Streptomyces sp. T1317-0309]
MIAARLAGRIRSGAPSVRRGRPPPYPGAVRGRWKPDPDAEGVPGVRPRPGPASSGPPRASTPGPPSARRRPMGRRPRAPSRPRLSSLVRPA